MPMGYSDRNLHSPLALTLLLWNAVRVPVREAKMYAPNQLKRCSWLKNRDQSPQACPSEHRRAMPPIYVNVAETGLE